MRSSSPTTDKQSVGGRMIFTFGNALTMASAWSRVTLAGFIDGETPATCSTSCAILGLMRENSFDRNDATLRAAELCSISINTPSSTPYGCGLMGIDGGGS